jgi:hypothetical protein
VQRTVSPQSSVFLRVRSLIVSLSDCSASRLCVINLFLFHGNSNDTCHAAFLSNRGFIVQEGFVVYFFFRYYDCCHSTLYSTTYKKQLDATLGFMASYVIPSYVSEKLVITLSLRSAVITCDPKPIQMFEPTVELPRRVAKVTCLFSFHSNVFRKFSFTSNGCAKRPRRNLG